jgi:hypothetical protein
MPRRWTGLGVFVVQCLVAAVVFGGSTVSFAAPALACKTDFRQCARAALRGHVVTRRAFWESAFARPLEQRIGIAPREVVDYVNYDNIANGYPDRPRAAKPSAGFLRDVQSAFAEIPPAVRQLLAPKLAGIVFVDRLGGTGYTDSVFDDAGIAVGGYIVLDASVLNKRNANAWATWKENTPFAAHAGIRLEAEIESPGQDNRKNAIQYILLHELAHVLAIGEKIHPYWNLEPKDIPSTDDYPFFRLSWAVDRANNRLVTLFDDKFPQRADIVYYFGAKLTADRMLATYENLERTNFVTLYSATKPGDDFAEAFASYVHTVLMGKPFAIKIHERGALARVYGPCWEEARCAEKRKILEQFLGIARRVSSR